MASSSQTPSARPLSPAHSDSSFELVEHEHPPVEHPNHAREHTEPPPTFTHDADLNNMTAKLTIEKTEGEGLPSYEEASNPMSSPVVLSPILATAPVNATHNAPEELYESAEQEKARLRDSYVANDAANPAPFTDEHPSARNSLIDEQIPVYSATPADPFTRGVAPTNVAALNRGLQIPSSTALISSGFPYPAEELTPYGVTADDWARFTNEITAAAKLEPSEWAVALGTGAGTAILAGIFIGWFALIPAFMVSRAAHKKQEKQKVSEALYSGHGDLEQRLLKWNQEFFAPRGILIRLDLPGQPGDIENMDVHQNLWVHKWLKEQKEKRASRFGNAEGGCSSKKSGEPSTRWEAKWARKEAKWEAKSARKEAKWENKSKRKAVKRGRIVIMPIRPAGTPTQSQERTTTPVLDEKKTLEL